MFTVFDIILKNPAATTGPQDTDDKCTDFFAKQGFVMMSNWAIKNMLLSSMFALLKYTVICEVWLYELNLPLVLAERTPSRQFSAMVSAASQFSDTHFCCISNIQCIKSISYLWLCDYVYLCISDIRCGVWVWSEPLPAQCALAFLCIRYET